MNISGSFHTKVHFSVSPCQVLFGFEVSGNIYTFFFFFFCACFLIGK